MSGLPDRKKPNFLIIAAPKCSTTSLVRWLETHPRVFLPPHRKEPHFFSGISPDLKRRRQYERLYTPATSAHTRRIDASTSYSRGFGIHRRFSQRTSQQYHRPRLRPDFERDLDDAFAEEVDRLEGLTGRDLSHWKPPMATASKAAE